MSDARNLTYTRGHLGAAQRASGNLSAPQNGAAIAALLRKAVACHQHGELAEAERNYRQILKLDAHHGLAQHYLGLIGWDRDNNDSAAVALIEKTAAANANSATMQHNLGGVYGIQGNIDAAVAQFTRALALQPDYAEAYFNLSTYVRFEANDPRIERMRRMLAEPERTRQDRCFLGFALGKALSDSGEYDEAFRCYTIGNDSAGRNFDAGVLDSYLQEIRATFTAQYFDERRDFGDRSETPVFIIGMPRSGTSLLEQIVASHRQITGAGEIRDIFVINSTLRENAQQLLGHEAKEFSHLPLLPRAAFQGMAESYLSRLAQYSDADTQRVVNKTPNNFIFLGLIATLFPRARIVHAVRDPIDTALSCYFQNFRLQQDFSFSLPGIVQYTRFYRACMAHWRSVAPLSILDVPYERIVSGDRTLVRAIVDYCGLPWDAACLRPHDTERAVRTASTWQVRQPLYTSSVQRWRRYEAHLGPLLSLRESV